MLYLSLKYIHILLAITALGANITYGVWFARANAEPPFAPVALRTIKLIDDRIANPAYGLLLPTGALMVWVGGMSFGTFWISAAMGMWLVLAVVGFAGYTPTLRRQIAAVERDGVDSPQARQLARRGQVLTGVLAVIVLAILFLMVFKPTSL